MALFQSAACSSPLIYITSIVTACLQAERLGLFRRGYSLSSIASSGLGHSQGIASACGLATSIRNLRRELGDRHCLAIVRALFEQGLCEQLNTGLRHFGQDDAGLYSGMVMIRGNPHDMARPEYGIDSVSIINSERSVVCSGEFALDMLAKEAQCGALEIRALPITVPFHCRHLEPSLFDLKQSFRELGGAPGKRCADWPVLPTSPALRFGGTPLPDMREAVATSQLSLSMDFPLTFERAVAGQQDVPTIVDFGPCEDAVALRLIDNVHSNAIAISAPGRKFKRQLSGEIAMTRGDFAAISERIKELCAEVLGARQLSADASLAEVGLTSQSVASLRSRLMDAFPDFAHILSAKVFFDCPTVNSITEYLMSSGASDSSASGATQVGYGALPPIEKISVYISQGSTYPLSFGQEQMLSMQVMNPDMTAYNVSGSVWIAGGLDPDKLRSCLEVVINRHEVFLSTATANPPMAKMRSVVPPVPIIWVPDEASALGRMGEVGRTPFNLLQESSLRVEILVTPSGLMLLNLWVHHMNFDIMSQGCFLRELYLLLSSTSVEATSLPTLPVQYVDYAYWSRQAAENGLYDASPIIKELAPHAGLVLDLPCDFPRPSRWSFLGDRVVTTLDSELVLPHEGITPFIAFLAAFFIQLSKVSGQENVIIGVPYHGRDQACLEPLCGYFINMVPVVNEAKHGTSVLSALTNVRDRWLRAAESSHVPFLYLMDKLYKEQGFLKDPSRNPVFQAMINYRKDSTVALPDSRFLAQPVHQVEAHMDFDMQIDQVGRNTTVITHNYCTSLFLPRTAELFAAQYMAVLRCLTSASWAKVDVYRLPSNSRAIDDIEQASVLSPETQYDMFQPLFEHLGVARWKPPLLVESDSSGGIMVSAC